jgi:hypothetical protein
MSEIRPPKHYPCASCPYRRDVPSGVWHESEYTKLPGYDLLTADQPPGVFMCHQDDERLCSGWVGTHDVEQLLSLRFAASFDLISVETLEEIHEYESPVPLFGSGAEACAHGLKDMKDPSPRAQQIVEKITDRRERRDVEQFKRQVQAEREASRTRAAHSLRREQEIARARKARGQSTPEKGGDHE